MRPWAERAPEVQALQNPAFLGEILHRFCVVYNKERGHPVPFAILFAVLPILVYSDLRATIRAKSFSQLHPWITANPRVRLQLPQRARLLLPYAKEAVMLLLATDRLRLENGYVTAVKPKSKRAKGVAAPPSHDCYTKAETLGRWCGRALNDNTIFIMLGVRP